MQITYSPSEVEIIVSNHILDTLQGSSPEDITSVSVHGDGSVTIFIGEEVSHEDDTPPVVEKQKRTRGPNKRNPQEAKHRPVETQTSVGGQNESSTPEPESDAEPVEQGEQVQTPEEELKEEATAEAEDAASQEASEEAAVQEEVQEKVEAEKPATAKPSLFAGLKR